MKKVLLHTLALATIVLAAACSNDTEDQPMPPTSAAQQSDDDPATDDPQDDPADAGEEEDYREPEPLSAEVRPLFGESKQWVRRSVYNPECQSKSKTWTEICAYNGLTFEGKKSWSFYDRTSNYNDPKARRGIYIEDGATLRSINVNNATNQSYLCFTVNPDDLRVSDYGYLLQSYGTIVLEGKTRRAIRVQREGSDYHDYWVEGIGALRGEIEQKPLTWPGVYEPLYVELLECYEGKEKIYDINHFSDDLYTPEHTFFPAL